MSRPFLADGYFFLLGQLGHFHAEDGAELVLGGGEDVLELAAGVGRHHWDCVSRSYMTVGV